MPVSAFLAAVAMGQAVGGAVGYERTGVLFIEPDSATLAVVNTADGSLCDVRRQLLAEDDDTAVAELAELLSGAESMRARPDGIYVVGSGIDVPMIKPALDAATSLTISVPEEHEMALARGAALASGSSPLFASTTAALAYAQDPSEPDETGGNDFAYSAHDDADARSGKSRPALLVRQRRCGGCDRRRGGAGSCVGDQYPPDGRVAAQAQRKPLHRSVRAGARAHRGGRPTAQDRLAGTVGGAPGRDSAATCSGACGLRPRRLPWSPFCRLRPLRHCRRRGCPIRLSFRRCFPS